MQHTGADVGHVDLAADELEVVDEGRRALTAAGNLDRDDAGTTLGQILLGQPMIGVAGQPGIVDLGDVGTRGQVLSHLLAIGADAVHANRQRLYAHVEQERRECLGIAAQVAHKLHAGLGDVGGIAELLGVNDAVVAGIGRGEARKTLGIGTPVELTRVDDHAADGLGVAVEVLGRGVHHDVGPPFERTAEIGGAKGVVHDERHTVTVGNTGKLLDIEYVHGGVGHGLAKDGLGVRTEGGRNLLFAGIGVHIAYVDAELLKGNRKEVDRAAVDGGGTHHMVARFEDVEQRDECGTLTTRSA